jgi:hypothetical protein
MNTQILIKGTRFLASTAVKMRSPLSWDVMQCRLVVSYRRFGTTYRSLLENQAAKSLDAEDGTDRLFQNVGNY